MKDSGSKARLMEFMTVKDVEEGLRETQTVILPVGCVEQHGWHLPLSTDIHNAYEIAKRISAVTGCFVAPTMPYSYSGGSLPGTINIAPQTVSPSSMTSVVLWPNRIQEYHRRAGSRRIGKHPGHS